MEEANQRHNFKEKFINKKPFIISYIKTLCLFLVGFLIMQTLCTCIFMIREAFDLGILVWLDHLMLPVVVIALIAVWCHKYGVKNMYIGVKSALTTTLLIHIIYILIMYSRSWNMYISDDFIFNTSIFVNEMGQYYNNVSMFFARWLYYVLDCFPARWFQMFAPMVVYIVVKAKEAKMQNVDTVK